MYKRNQNTTGPLKVTREVINNDTGEILYNSRIENKDRNFYKFWPQNLYDYMQENFIQKDLTFFKLLQIMDKHNKINYTLKDMCKKLDLKDRQFRSELKEMKRFDIIRKIKNGTYMVNPNIIYQSSSDNRNIALAEYFGLQESKEFIEEQERQKKIKKVTTQLQRLSPYELSDIIRKEKLENKILKNLAENLVDMKLR